MEETLTSGDKVLVNKIVYGPKLPVSLNSIPIISLVRCFHDKVLSDSNHMNCGHHHLLQHFNFKRGEIMVFSQPLFEMGDNYFIKRCVAVPGDTLKIKVGKVIINNTIWTESDDVVKRYRIWIKNSEQFDNIIDNLEIPKINHVHRLNGNSVELNMSNRLKEKLLQMDCVDSIKIKTVPTDSTKWVYPQNKLFQWTIDNYGPFVIPFKGMKIQLTMDNVLLYGRTINQLEGVELEKKDGHFYLNGLRKSEYTFKGNYYFMMGDNRHDSNDSRYWGVVPEENIVGRADIVLFNYQKHKFQWNRLLKLIR